MSQAQTTTRSGSTLQSTDTASAESSGLCVAQRGVSADQMTQIEQQISNAQKKMWRAKGTEGEPDWAGLKEQLIEEAMSTASSLRGLGPLSLRGNRWGGLHQDGQRTQRSKRQSRCRSAIIV